ncbi:MAG: hypothetical protein IT267_07165 [Saprospiraceae bacterium]|nr:hypothetical protein [Saprospiraceae bacterium]
MNKRSSKNIMENINYEIAKYIENEGGKLVDSSIGFDQEFSKDDFMELTPNRFVSPYIIFSSNIETFRKTGEKCSDFNRNYKDDKKFIYWKVVVFESEIGSSKYCLSVTTNRMDLHDPFVILGLTKQKRSELLDLSKQLLSSFLDYLKKDEQI